jgi:tRNA(His) 5'-end guanylyltransferase
MKTDELEGRMRAFEEAMDPCVLPGVWMVARLDGRNFTRLTKEVHPFEKPFDPRFHDLMVQTTEALMGGCGLSVAYAYTQSDEISLLMRPDEAGFGRRHRKLLSLLSGEASARFSLLLGAPAVFDCRVSPLPTGEAVVDYFRWRAEDARRNALSAHCYWRLRSLGQQASQADAKLRGLSASGKHDLLHRHGVQFNILPAWQRRGSGLYWEPYDRTGTNPITGEPTTARRRRIRRESDLPVRDAYSAFLRGLLARFEDRLHTRSSRIDR